MDFYENPISDDQRYRNVLLTELIKINNNLELLLRHNAQVSDSKPVAKTTTRGGGK
jgi:hypothetical protein